MNLMKNKKAFSNNFINVSNTKNVFQNSLMRSTEDFTMHFLAGNSALLLFLLVQCKGGNELSACVVSLILRIIFRSHLYHSSAYSCFHSFPQWVDSI